MPKHRKWTSAAKFKIAMEAIKGEVTLNELCKRYEIAPSQIHAWKKQLLSHGDQIFAKSDKALKETEEREKAKQQLYEKIGELTVERDYLKKCWSKLQGYNAGS